MPSLFLEAESLGAVHAPPAIIKTDCYTLIVNEKTRSIKQAHAASCSSDQHVAGAAVYSCVAIFFGGGLFTLGERVCRVSQAERNAVCCRGGKLRIEALHSASRISQVKNLRLKVISHLLAHVASEWGRRFSTPSKAKSGLGQKQDQDGSTQFVN